MANQQQIDKILNKQFKKTAFAGYETIDVDSFFDTVIDYLKANDKAVEEYKKVVEKLLKEKQELIAKIDSLNQQLAAQKQLILQYESEGYGNVMTAKRISALEEKMNKMEKGKDNGK